MNNRQNPGCSPVARLSTPFTIARPLGATNAGSLASIAELFLPPGNQSGKVKLYDWAKPVVDVTTSAIAIILLSPLWLIIALLVRVTSSGPALFRQQRVGRDGALFTMYKFRTMYHDVPRYGCSPITKSDSRITVVGRFLRRTSLDELPQFINVVLGQMSLVGPRPEMPFIAEEYTAEQRRRLSAVPGITGLWQISRHRGAPIHQHVKLDFYYIKRRSFRLDARILWRTFFVAARGV